MKILYYGDSITDCGRNCDRGSMLNIGQGYALITCAKLGAEYPGKFEFDNTGISGNRIVDLYARIKCDCWNCEPDVLSILIGVNDVWHEINYRNGVEADRFEAMNRMMIADTLKARPGIKIMILEPFILKGYSTVENWEAFDKGTKERAVIAKKIAEEFNLVFVPLQQIFDDACKVQPATYWIADGVHPTPAGHQLIADAWLDAFKKNIM